MKCSLRSSFILFPSFLLDFREKMRKFCRYVRLCLSLCKNCAKLKLAYFFVCYCVKTPRRNRIHKNPVRQKQDCILLTFFLFDSKKVTFFVFFLFFFFRRQNFQNCKTFCPIFCLRFDSYKKTSGHRIKGATNYEPLFMFFHFHIFTLILTILYPPLSLTLSLTLSLSLSLSLLLFLPLS